MGADEILNDPLRNKGTAFTQKERDTLGLNGFLPYHVSTIEEQVARRYQNFKLQESSLAKWAFLTSLQSRNETLFYRLVSEHIEEMLPFIYTPTVGDVSLHYSSLYKQQRGVYFSYPLKEKIATIVAMIARKEVDVIVITDGERILGLGDLGAGGMAIPIGKLTLYTLFGGIHPARTLPVTLDVGTNNPALLGDPNYIGWSHERLTGEAYYDFVDLVVQALKKRYPQVVLQWEDFGRTHAKPLFDKYQDQLCSFNDDIQGTAAVVSAALLAAVKQSGGKLQHQRIVVFGGGSAGMGICNQLLGILREERVPEKEIKKVFHVVDVDGLVHTGQKNILPSQLPFARPQEEIATWSGVMLSDVIAQVRPTVLIGVSAQAGVFTESLITSMARYVERPIIFPLSNPTSKSEAHPADLLNWTKGKAIIATGSPFDPVHYQGLVYPIPQCNNVYIFPGVGLGLVACKAKKVHHRMFYQATRILADHAPFGALFPPLEQLRAISKKIAAGVIKVAEEEGLASTTLPLETVMWNPTYR